MSDSVPSPSPIAPWPAIDCRDFEPAIDWSHLERVRISWLIVQCNCNRKFVAAVLHGSIGLDDVTELVRSSVRRSCCGSSLIMFGKLRLHESRGDYEAQLDRACELLLRVAGHGVGPIGPLEVFQ